MFEVKIKDISKLPEWLRDGHKNGDIIEINNIRALYGVKKGEYEILRHFNIVTRTDSICKYCGAVKKRRVKEYI